MATALVFNPGSNSLKFEVVATAAGQRFASEATKRVSAAVENFGDAATFTVFQGRETKDAEQVRVPDMAAAARFAVGWLRDQAASGAIDFAAVRVVHGGEMFAGATRATKEVRAEVGRLEELAPLHNRSALEILDVLDAEMKGSADGDL